MVWREPKVDIGARTVTGRALAPAVNSAVGAAGSALLAAGTALQKLFGGLSDGGSTARRTRPGGRAQANGHDARRASARPELVAASLRVVACSKLTRAVTLLRACHR
jgi:hypothetical protein